MGNIEEIVKQYYQYIGTDGKFIINESMPIEQQKVFAFLNQSCADVRTILDDIENGKGFVSEKEETDSDENFILEESMEEENDSTTISEDGNVLVDDLDDFFG